MELSMEEERKLFSKNIELFREKFEEACGLLDISLFDALFTVTEAPETTPEQLKAFEEHRKRLIGFFCAMALAVPNNTQDSEEGINILEGNLAFFMKLGISLCIQHYMPNTANELLGDVVHMASDEPKRTLH